MAAGRNVIGVELGWGWRRLGAEVEVRGFGGGARDFGGGGSGGKAGVGLACDRRRLVRVVGGRRGIRARCSGAGGVCIWTFFGEREGSRFAGGGLRRVFRDLEAEGFSVASFFGVSTSW